MSDTTTTVQPAKRGRNGSVVLTDRMCEKRVTKRTKIYDRKCPGLYVSITPAGVATLSLKFTDREPANSGRSCSASITRRPSPSSMPAARLTPRRPWIRRRWSSNCTSARCRRPSTA